MSNLPSRNTPHVLQLVTPPVMIKLSEGKLLIETACVKMLLFLFTVLGTSLNLIFKFDFANDASKLY